MIAEFIKISTAAGEDDVIVLGDYNMIPGEDSGNFAALNPERYLRFISTREPFRRSTTPHGNFLDGFAVSRKKMTEYLDGSFRVYQFNRVYRKSVKWYEDNVSDHYPIVARFDITKDRD